MKPFVLHSKMLNFRGVFYPTGYAIVLFPQLEHAEEAARELQAAGVNAEKISLLTPEIILTQIAKVDGESDLALPPVGTESATIHKYVDLAREGHYGLMVHSPSHADTERVTAVLKQRPFSYAQKYHLLAMEDLE